MKLTKDYLRKLINEVQSELKLKSLIREQLEDELQESEASDEAHKKGLKSAGFGRWKNSSGKVVAQTKDGKLEMKKNSEKNILEKMSINQKRRPF